ncbi:MAG: FAD:protein FMN transferase, partial [Candidatus Micrarchaeota archaeon]|nr:FAD:protein FMN transferase [Candidatus Micrarchaeota archaeon]
MAPRPRLEAGVAARSEPALGSVIEIKLPQRHAGLFPLCFSEIGRIERSFTRFKETSELSRLNRRLGVWQGASDELIALALRAEEFRQKTDGYFDITVKARLEQLGYGPKSGGQETKKPFDPLALLRGLGPSVRVDRKNGRIWLGKQIEFGGLGKGYALDCVAALLEKSGADHYFINAGGDVYARRGRGQGPWTVLLEHP